MAENAPHKQVHIEGQGGENQISSGSKSGGSPSGTLPPLIGQSNSVLPENSKAQPTFSMEEAEQYAREGMITFLSDPGVAVEHFRAGMHSPLVHYGYAFVFFIRAMVSFRDNQQEEAYGVLEAASAHCHQARKSMPKGSASRAYYATLEHDCVLFQSFLHFLKESMPGYIRGGLGIRKVWKAYSKTFKKTERLFSSRPPIRPPFSDSDESCELGPEPMQHLRSLEERYPPGQADSPARDGDVATAEESHVRRAVYMGYGTFHLMLSLIPQKFLKLANLLGFQGDRRFALECLQFGLTGKDMREPIAAIIMLWFQALFIPFVSLSGTADRSVEIEQCRCHLRHLTELSPNSSLVRFFSARISLLARDIDVAIAEFIIAGQGSFFPKDMYQVACQERTFLAMLRSDFQLAHELIQSIIDNGTRFLSIYQHALGLLTGYTSDAKEAIKLFESGSKQEITRTNPMEKYSQRRCAYYAKQGVTYVGMHVALMEMLYVMNSFGNCPPAELAATLEAIQGSVASATDPLTRCMGLLTQGSVLKYLGCPNEAEESIKAILSYDQKQLKSDKHILVYANMEMGVLSRTHRRDPARALSFLHTARDKFSDYDFDGRIQLIINREISFSKALRRQAKADN